MVSNILSLLRGGYTIPQILEYYPELTEEDVKAAIDYATAVIEEETILTGLILLRVHPQTVEVLHPVLQDFLQRIKPEDLKGSIATLESHRYRLRKVRW